VTSILQFLSIVVTDYELVDPKRTSKFFQQGLASKLLLLEMQPSMFWQEVIHLSMADPIDEVAIRNQIENRLPISEISNSTVVTSRAIQELELMTIQEACSQLTDDCWRTRSLEVVKRELVYLSFDMTLINRSSSVAKIGAFLFSIHQQQCP
jgi:hypothetical protein